MRYPDFLRDKGTIGFVAPSFGCSTEPYRTAFDNALGKFRQMGYRCVLGPNCYQDSGVGISNLPELCADELNSFYCSDDNDMLISCGGGELMCEVVPYIDFEAIAKARPKWYLGFSDNTNFTFLSTTLADTAAIYGPCASSFGMEPWHESIQDTMDLITGRKKVFHGYDLWEREGIKDETNPLAGYNLTEPKHLRIAGVQGDFLVTGRLIGGCMDCLALLLGTEFDKVDKFINKYRGDGFIWFLESCDLNVMSIRRVLWQMKHAGWFRHVNGFIIGRPLHFGEEMFGIDQYSAVTSMLGELGVPIIMDADIGHLSPMMPIISGGMADVSVKNHKMTIKYI